MAGKEETAAPAPKQQEMAPVKVCANTDIFEPSGGGVQYCWGVPFQLEETGEGENVQKRLVAELSAEDAAAMMEAGRVRLAE